MEMNEISVAYGRRNFLCDQPVDGKLAVKSCLYSSAGVTDCTSCAPICGDQALLPCRGSNKFFQCESDGQTTECQRLPGNVPR